MTSFRTVLCLSLLSLFILSTVQSTQPSDFTTLPISQDSQGNHYIQVTWNSNSKQSNAATQESETGKMALNLYSGETFVAACDSFKSYPKIQSDLKLEGKQMRQVSLLNQESVTGYSIPLTIQTPAFILANFPAMHAVRCDSGLKHDLHGYLGLGSGSNNILGALSSFSVFLSNGKDHFASKLFVGAQDSLSHIYGDRSFHLTADTQDNWMMNIKNVQVSQKSLGVQGSFSVVFDLNTDFIGVPSQIYNVILKTLQENGVSCDGSTSQCQNFTQTLTLPTFELVIDGNKTSSNRIPLTSDLYFNKTTSSLLIKPANANSAYENSVVLGAPFMREYFVQFQQARGASQGHVTIFKAKHDKSLNKHELWMIIGVAVVSFCFIIAVAIGVYMIKFYGVKGSSEQKQAFLGNIQGESSEFRINTYEEKEPISGGLIVTTN
jgi:hypothetical protein